MTKTSTAGELWLSTRDEVCTTIHVLCVVTARPEKAKKKIALFIGQQPYPHPTPVVTMTSQPHYRFSRLFLSWFCTARLLHVGLEDTFKSTPHLVAEPTF